ncbi:Alpha/Beta hydrolase protein [Mycena olivaceomarginata]|nr:Alpha/Beta hydrolase protein [Mycena olivaceomarginata]
MELVDIPYIADSKDRHLAFDLYSPPSATDGSMIVFVHGGAWGADDNWPSLPTAPILVPNYRLTTKANGFRHPGHAEDILHFLEFLTVWDGIPDIFNPAGRGMYLLGQSCGAHILSSIFLDSSAISPTLTPSPSVLRATKGIALSEGIFDIDLLLTRFPEYRDWFIAAAFGDQVSYADFSATLLPLREPESEHASLRWLMIHSTGDTLVDQPQSDAMYAHLRALYGAAADAHVARNIDQLDVEHDDVPVAPLFIELIRAFVEGAQ